MERGGPPISGEPDHSGFGTQLAAMSVEQQLGGTIRRDWQPDGLFATLTFPLSALSRDAGA